MVDAVDKLLTDEEGVAAPERVAVDPFIWVSRSNPDMPIGVNLSTMSMTGTRPAVVQAMEGSMGQHLLSIRIGVVCGETVRGTGDRVITAGATPWQYRD